MALFEFEAGRLIPAQFGRPVSADLSEDVVDAICAQVLEIVSRPLFPITWRNIARGVDDDSQTPRLTSLDATGQVVSVEVMTHLDSDALISSLSRLAQTAALSWSDLAREYPGGVEGFKVGWFSFKDSMPPSPVAGPRLIMVVGAIDPQVRPALDVLATSGVEVHEVSLRQMSNGRIFLEVSAVGPRLYTHAPQLLLTQTERPAQIEAAESVEAVDSAQVEAEPAPLEQPVEDAPVDTEDSSSEEPPVQPEPPSEPEDITQARADGVPVLGRDAQSLAILAEIIGEDVPLVAHQDCGAPEDLWLTRQGTLRSGEDVWLTPKHLEAAAPKLADAWDHLRISDMRGPSLAESLTEVNREIIREYSQAVPRSAPARHGN